MSDILVIDTGGTHIKFAAVTDGVARELGRHVPTRALRNAEPVESLARLIAEVGREMGIRP